MGCDDSSQLVTMYQWPMLVFVEGFVAKVRWVLNSLVCCQKRKQWLDRLVDWDLIWDVL